MSSGKMLQVREYFFTFEALLVLYKHIRHIVPEEVSLQGL
jgi:hypothetical protein